MAAIFGSAGMESPEMIYQGTKAMALEESSMWLLKSPILMCVVTYQERDND